MPRYKLLIEKQMLGEYWVNDYHFTATDLDDAESKAGPIIDAERAITGSAVTFTQYRISTVDPDDGIFRTLALNEPGEVSFVASYMQLWNVVRVDFAAASGRAGRKYLRGCLSEDSVQFDILTPAEVAAVQTNYCDPLVALGYLEKPDGVLLTDSVVNSKMGMRQLRRGSKRKTTPIIP